MRAWTSERVAVKLGFGVLMNWTWSRSCCAKDEALKAAPLTSDIQLGTELILGRRICSVASWMHAVFWPVNQRTVHCRCSADISSMQLAPPTATSVRTARLSVEDL